MIIKNNTNIYEWPLTNVKLIKIIKNIYQDPKFQKVKFIKPHILGWSRYQGSNQAPASLKKVESHNVLPASHNEWLWGLRWLSWGGL